MHSGTIHFLGEDITNDQTENIVARGISMAPEGRRIFPNLTVLENIRIGAYLRNDDLAEDIERMYEL